MPITRRITSDSGYSIIEQAIIIPLVLLVGFCAFDINTLIQSKSTARTAVALALRRCSASDGGCFTPANASAEPGNRYRWYIAQPAARAIYKESLYSGRASWFEYDRIVWSNFKANMLKQSEATVKKCDYVVNSTYKTGKLSYAYVRRSLLFPYLKNGSGPAAFDSYGDPVPSLTTLASSSGAGAKPASPLPAASDSGLSASITMPGDSADSVRESRWSDRPADDDLNWRTLSTIRINLPEALKGLRCFSGDPLRASSASELSGISCGLNWPWLGTSFIKPDTSDRLIDNAETAAFTYAVLAINGVGHARAGESGEVEIRLKWSIDGRSATRHLGGQIFGSGTRNFYVRGLPCSSSFIEGYRYFCKHDSASSGRRNPSDRKLEEDMPREFIEHQAILLRYGIPYELQFRVRRRSEHVVSWSLTGVDVYAPRYDKYSGSIQCENKVPSSVPDTSYSCQHPGQSLPFFSESFPVEFSYSSEAYTTLKGVLSEDEARTALSTLSGGKEPSALTLGTKTCAIEVRSAPCQLPNHCVNGCSSNAGGWLDDSPEAQKACPVAVTAIERASGAVSGERWQVESMDVAHEPVVFELDHCPISLPSGPESLPADLAGYSGLSWQSETYRQSLYPGRETMTDPALDSMNPVQLKKEARFACAGIWLQTQSYTCSGAPNPDGAQSAFCRKIPDNSLCMQSEKISPDSYHWLLRAEAESSFGLKPGAFFETNQVYSGETATQCGEADILSSCTPFRLVPCGSSEEAEIPGGPFPQGHVPEICQLPAKVCRSEIVTAQSGGSAQTMSVQTMVIREDLFRTVEAALPWAKRDCQGVGCVSVAVSDSVAMRSDGLFSVEVAINTPLNFLPNLIPQWKDHGVPVSWRGSDRWEGQLVR